MISSGRAPLSKGSVFLPYFSIAENLLCCLRLSYVVTKAPELVLYHHIDRADCVFPKPFLMWWVRGCSKGTISLVLISVSAIQKDIDSKYIHLQSQKVLPIYLCVQRKEANKFLYFYSVGGVHVKPTCYTFKIKLLAELLWPWEMESLGQRLVIAIPLWSSQLHWALSGS